METPPRRQADPVGPRKWRRENADMAAVPPEKSFYGRMMRRVRILRKPPNGAGGHLPFGLFGANAIIYMR
jgi:hypothetical protein